MAGSVTGEASQKAITGASVTPDDSNPAISGSTVTPHTGVTAPIADAATALEVAAERAMLARLDGSCRTPNGFVGFRHTIEFEPTTDGTIIEYRFAIPALVDLLESN